MQVSMATSGGHAGRANEDFVGAVPGCVVLLDGAGIPGAEAICSHGVTWYTHRLGGALLGRLSRGDGQDMTGILATSISELADEHRGTCDLTDPSSPQATVLMARLHDGRLDYLLLADSYLVLGLADGQAQVVTDRREVASGLICSAPLAGISEGTPEYDRIRASCVTAMRARRNQPGGYWIAKDDPRAADEAVTGSLPLSDLESIAVLSNGASRIVSPYGLTDWPGVLALLRSDGPAELIGRVRRAEEPGGHGVRIPDDATVAYCTELLGG